MWSDGYNQFILYSISLSFSLKTDMDFLTIVIGASDPVD